MAKKNQTIYGFEHMGVGDIIPYKIANHPDDREWIDDRLRSLRTAASKYGRKYNKRFSVRHLKEARHWAHIERTR